MRRADMAWAGALAVLVLIGYGIIPTPDARTPDDSFSSESAGKKAFYFIAEELLTDVSRSAASLIPADDNADTLVMLGPARYPDRAQWQTLYDWVSQGRALVFAARWEDPAVELGPFGIEIVPSDLESSSSVPAEENAGVDGGDDGDNNETGSDAGPIVTGLVDGSFEWQSQGRVLTSGLDADVASEPSVELAVNGNAQVVWRPIGDGAIVVVATDHIFTNRSLMTGNHGLLAFRILETAAPTGPTYFDESMNAAGAPRVVGVLLESPFRLITLQLAMILLLFGWMVNRRFGPVQVAEGSARRSLVEHARALGNLHFKTGSGARIVSSYLEFFRQRFGLRHRRAGGGLERGPGARLTEEASTAIDAALEAAGNSELSRDRVGEVIRSLARLPQ